MRLIAQVYGFDMKALYEIEIVKEKMYCLKFFAISLT